VNGDVLEMIDCACYTHARRHPEVLGRIGRTVLPVQVTGAALVTWCVAFVGLVVSWARWWGAFVPVPMAVLVVAGVPVALGWLAMVTSIGGRNPFLAAGGVVRYLLRVRAGVVNGRPVRGRRRVMVARVMFGVGR
jgi:hypothetical protein